MLKDLIKEVIRDGITFLEISPIKLKAILWLCYYTGLTRSQITTLKRSDFDLEKKFLYTPKIRIRLSPSLVKMLRDYFEEEEEDKNALNMTQRQWIRLFDRLNGFLAKKSLKSNIFAKSYKRRYSKNTLNQYRASLKGEVNGKF